MTWDETGEEAPPAVDRRDLARESPVKPNRWPRTDRRTSRLKHALARRQPDLMVVLENVHDEHNIAAVMRSCDAVGIQQVHLIYTVEAPPAGRFARRVSAGTAKWLDVHQWTAVDDCYAALRERDISILALALGQESASVFDTDLTEPVALVFGNEMRGLSEEAVDSADRCVHIPMVGMVQSLNISVSFAVAAYEAYRQREVAGAYAKPKLGTDIIDAKLAEWLEK